MKFAICNIILFRIYENLLKCKNALNSVNVFSSTFIYFAFYHTDRIFMSTPWNHDNFCCFVYHVSAFDVFANLFNIMTTFFYSTELWNFFNLFFFNLTFFLIVFKIKSTQCSENSWLISLYIRFKYFLFWHLHF